jgi:hypothetical protein
VLGRKHRENGLLARLLLAMPPDVPGRWTEDDLDESTEALLARVVSGLLALDHTCDPEGNLAPVPVPFTLAARAAFVEWWEANEKAVANETGDLRASLAKLPAYVARLALIFELTAAAATDAHVAAVELASVNAAIAVVEWFGAEAARVVELLDQTEEEQEERTVAEWIERRGGTTTIADLARSGPRLYRGKSEAAEEVLDRLVRAGRACWEDTTGTGRPTRVVRLLAAGAEM